MFVFLFIFCTSHLDVLITLHRHYLPITYLHIFIVLRTRNIFLNSYVLRWIFYQAFLTSAHRFRPVAFNGGSWIIFGRSWQELAWLRSEVDNTKQDDLRQLAQAAGLRVRREDNVSWCQRVSCAKHWWSILHQNRLQCRRSSQGKFWLSCLLCLKVSSSQ